MQFHISEKGDAERRVCATAHELGGITKDLAEPISCLNSQKYYQKTHRQPINQSFHQAPLGVIDFVFCV